MDDFDIAVREIARRRLRRFRYQGFAVGLVIGFAMQALLRYLGAF